MLFLGRPSDERLARVLHDLSGTPLTYAEAGATRDGALPDGYHHARATRVLGRGDEAFALGCDGIRTWQMHRRQGFRVMPPLAPIAAGTDVVVAVPLAAPLHVLAACRIVWVVDEPDRFGFAYGTLATHPASGEESFVVERCGAGDVRAVVTAFSRPRHPLARLAGPLARRQQAAATEGYLAALASHIADTGGAAP